MTDRRNGRDAGGSAAGISGISAVSGDLGEGEVNRPEVVAAIAAEFAGYEAALVAGDKAALAGYFWSAPETVRFGIADTQVGARRLREWRDAQPPLPPGRTLSGTRIATFGTGCAVVTTLFRYPGRSTLGRQSQTWIRFPPGWRIVHAHVSEIPASPAMPAQR